MASSHVPNDQVPLQAQSPYPDPHSYDHLFPRANQFVNAPSWDQFGRGNPALLPQTAPALQPWHHNNVPHQPYSSVAPPNQAYATPSHGSPPHTNVNHGPSAHPAATHETAGHGYQPAPAYQYAQYSNHGPMGSYINQPAVDPALSQEPVSVRQHQQSPYQQALRSVAPQGQPTVSPQALQQTAISHQNGRPTASPYQVPKSTTEMFSQRPTPTPLPMQPVSNPEYEVPKGKLSGGFSLINEAALAKATNSTALNKFVNLGNDAMYLATNRTALPIYNSRQSIKEIKKSSAGSKKLLDKSPRKLSSTKILLSKSPASKLNAGSPSALQQDVSDSDDYTDSSDDSEYTDDEDEEQSPLPASRPDDPHQAVRYDVIKSTWYPRKSQPSAGKIKSSLAEFWEVLNTIQKRWRQDSKAVVEAEEQKKTAELPVLKSRVTGQRDLLESALKSALEFGHPDILYHLGKVKTFLYLCYQFLANRFKMQDYDGGLSSVIYQVLARAAGTLTSELIEETRLIKALNSMKKNANEANKALIQKVIDGAVAGSKKPKVNSPPQDDGADPKGAKRPAPSPAAAARPSADASPAKKLKTSEPTANLLKKPSPASAAQKPAAASNLAPQKRPGEKPTVAPVKARGNQVVNKPSSFFSTLNAASKKPASVTSSLPAPKTPQVKTGTATAVKDKKPAPAAAKPGFSFAETMALLEPKKEVTAAPKPEKQLPPETPEEKAKRLRKESRRHLRVSFRPDASLVDIRYFSHDPEEELGHDENFVRDAGDIGGEGRMFKQHRDMVEEDDDDEPEVTYRPWKEPTAVDFSVVDAGERSRNYAPYGGGEAKPECPEKEANQRRENSTLMVYYSDPSDIPPSPREPVDAASLTSTPVREFGTPGQLVLDRQPKPPGPAATPDLSFLEAVVGKLAGKPPLTQPPPAPSMSAYAPPQPAPSLPAGFDTNLSAILSRLQPAVPMPASVPVAVPPVPSLAGIDLSAFYSAAQQAPPVPAAAFPPVPANWTQLAQNFNQPQSIEAALQFLQPPQFNQPANATAGAGAKRPRDEGNNSADRGHSSFKKQKNTNPPKYMYGGERPHKVLPCRFYQQGKCTKGEDCTYIHDRN